MPCCQKIFLPTVIHICLPEVSPRPRLCTKEQSVHGVKQSGKGRPHGNHAQQKQGQAGAHLGSSHKEEEQKHRKVGKQKQSIYSDHVPQFLTKSQYFFHLEHFTKHFFLLYGFRRPLPPGRHQKTAGGILLHTVWFIYCSL